jgi:hypothetical protein
MFMLLGLDWNQELLRNPNVAAAADVVVLVPLWMSRRKMKVVFFDNIGNNLS